MKEIVRLRRLTGENIPQSTCFSPEILRLVSVGVLITLFLQILPGMGDAWCAPPANSPKPTPPVSSALSRQKQTEELYKGYARLFVLGHIFSRALGAEGVMPRYINLGIFAEQPLLAEAGDVFIYRPSERGDIMWPLLIPTPPREPLEPPPTETPTPIAVVYEETPTPTLTPTPTPTEVVPPPLQLQIACLSESAPIVMIDNTTLTLGDTVREATITEIKRNHVTIEYYGATFYITKDGTIKPEEFDERDLLYE